MSKFQAVFRISRVARDFSLFASTIAVACFVPAMSWAGVVVNGGITVGATTVNTSVTDQTSNVTYYPAGGQGTPGTAGYVNGADSGSATTSLGSGSSGPSVTATSTSSTDPVSADAFVSYQLEVKGSSGQTDTAATLDITASGSAAGTASSASFYGSSSAIFDLYVPQATTYLGFSSFEALASVSCNTGACNSFSAPFSLSGTQWTVPINELLTVDIEANVNASVVQGTLSATVDPNIYLDTNNPSGLSLAFSQGINQPGTTPSSVPEPPALPSLALGTVLALLANARRRKRPKQPFRISDLMRV